MIDKVIKKYNLDVDSIKREGTIACLTFLTSWIFFGINNAILAYPIALTSSILLKENFKINPLEKTIRLLFLYCFLETYFHKQCIVYLTEIFTTLRNVCRLIRIRIYQICSY